MKQIQGISLAGLAVAVMVFGASTASATTLEVAGVGRSESIAIKSSLKSGTTAHLDDTAGGLVNTCIESTVEGHTESPYTAPGTIPIGGPITTLTFNKCTGEPVVVDLPGRLTVSWINGTTNGTVRSSVAKVTMPSPFGSLTCTTATSPGTDIGTLTGVASGAAAMNINAVLNCGFFLPSARWQATYTVTSPEGLGVTDMAAATTLEVAGVGRSESIAIKSSLKSGTTARLDDTGGAFANTCTESTVEGKTEAPFSGPTVGGKVSSLSFSSCTEEKVVVDESGSLTVERIAGSTNGTVRSIGAKVTTPSPFGSLTCVTAASPGTDIGKLTGVASGTATVDINAVLNCGFFLPSARWEGTYTVTSPEGLGVTS
ncbi:MAG TPA: hypothetical protein VGW80_09935 [Solirubrobacterales bacterium]|nr:hypothetical protein [Solirubrobacterales bacterium]